MTLGLSSSVECLNIILQMEMSGSMNLVLDKLASLTEEVQDLKKENERLRQLL